MKYLTKAYWSSLFCPAHAAEISRLESLLATKDAIILAAEIELKMLRPYNPAPKSSWLQDPPPPPPVRPEIEIRKEGSFAPRLPPNNPIPPSERVFVEGKERKGGLNSPPKTPRPDIAPAPQRPHGGWFTKP